VRSRFAVLFLAVGALAVSAVAATAAPHHNKGLTIAATPDPIIAGDGVLIYGQLDGTTVAGQTIDLYHKVAPATKYTLIQKTTTNSDGFYEFTRAEGKVITNRDWYVTGPSKTHSKTIEEKVQAVVDLTTPAASSSALTGSPVVFTGSVYPAHAHQTVRIQEQNSVTGNGWRTIASGKTTSLSTFAISKRFAYPGDYTLRAEFGADKRNVASASDSVTLSVQQKENPEFTINTDAPVIAEGGSADLTGTLYSSSTPLTPKPSTAIELWGSTAGGKFVKVAPGTTGLDGSYSFTVAPKHNTVYQVRAAKVHTARLYEGVADVVIANYSSTTPTAGTAITVTGTVSPNKNGHWIYLQELRPDGSWATIVGGKVTTGSAYSLSYAFGSIGSYKVRVRIFGGPENVGAASAAQDVTVSPAPAASTLPPATP
jgi:hypothetical protein